MNVVSRARYRARLAEGAADRNRALALRQRCFRAQGPDQDDSDAHDAICRHLLVEAVATGEVAAYCRVLILRDGRDVQTSYSALHYDLAALSAYPAPMMEIGRFCIEPACRDPDVLRVAWAALTVLVDRFGAQILFGCSSFAGASVSQHRAALALLGSEHRAPDKWAPGRRSAATHDLAASVTDAGAAKSSVQILPPLLRSYLAMGGWVSDHAVIDHDLDTIHVFTGLEVAAIPPVRVRALRALAAEIGLGGLSGD